MPRRRIIDTLALLSTWGSCISSSPLPATENFESKLNDVLNDLESEGLPNVDLVEVALRANLIEMDDVLLVRPACRKLRFYLSQTFPNFHIVAASAVSTFSICNSS